MNIGAFLAPLITSPLGEQVNWHLGFASAGFFMLLGLIQYKFTARYLDDVGNGPVFATEEEVAGKNKLVVGLRIFSIAVIGLLALAFLGIIPVDAVSIADASGVLILGVSFFFLGYVIFFGGLSEDERKKTVVIGIVFIFSAIFWSGFEQAGSTLNLFAQRFTDLNILGYECQLILQSIIIVIISSPYCQFSPILA